MSDTCTCGHDREEHTMGGECFIPTCDCPGWEPDDDVDTDFRAVVIT